MMSAEEFRAQLGDALATAIAGDTDLDEVSEALEEAQARVEEVRAMRGEA
ncbi:hypothetical protein [Natrinema salifodinae]|uniref:Uncharacterized protein n=1 Tax=Natrinema salifodinae TaxID=1202768 RepID=A0A1I0P6S4_9EURY|nr:hypothetical protein [Natrinema salifodinae]SEW09942.1 hypothetical protein SAMN05216285_2206 [Natrinema salifodinae]